MIKLSSLITVLVLIVAFCNTTGNAQDNPFVIGKIEQLTSKILGEKRTIYVHVPRGGGNQKYPVLYLLDGGGFFPPTVSILQMDGRFLPQMIIVGISNQAHRNRDLTPSSYADLPNSGGGKKFTQFIEKELIPYIDGKYPTHPYRTLVGYSLGGWFAINTLVNYPHLFNNYIAIDPSLRRDKALAEKTRKYLKTKGKFSKKSLFLAVANTVQEIKGLDTSNVMQDKSFLSRHMRAGLALGKAATQQNNSKLAFTWKYYPNDDHASVPYSAVYDGLRSVFAWYKMSVSKWATIKNPKTSAKEVLAIFNNYYARLSEQFGYQMLPEESYLNSLGYRCLQMKSLQRAKVFFQMAIKLYPKSANVYDSMADYYIAQKDRKNALYYVTKAYEISGDQFHKKRIEKLTTKK